jgi:hypothetical protein
MDFIKGFTFAPFCSGGTFRQDNAKLSLLKMKERTGANLVIFAPNGLQDTAQSEKIDYQTEDNVSDDELLEMIQFAKQIGLRVALKPTVNCRNGVWRAYISFFEEDVVCEPKWKNWFAAYEAFQVHYAKIAEQMGCEMFIAGCEMVMSEHREMEWRKLIGRLREEFHGLISYNTDKYQEHNVKWWDAVDVISSSGYYPIDDWENQLNRIEKVILKYQKPFFFAELGCMSLEGSSARPNDWNLQGTYSEDEQESWFRETFMKCSQKSWLRGYAIWSWGADYLDQSDSYKRSMYEVYGKKAELVIKETICD